jgi:hypothetical protein
MDECFSLIRFLLKSKPAKTCPAGGPPGRSGGQRFPPENGSGNSNAEFCRSLSDLDRRFRRDWNRSFFEFFYPVKVKQDRFGAFEGCPGMGESSYTACWVSFSEHRPFLEVLRQLVLNPGELRLSFGLDRAFKQVSLEQELLNELRRESDEVRELLKSPDIRGEPLDPPFQGKPPEQNPGKYLPPPAYTAPASEDMRAFLAKLDGAERAALMRISAKAGTDRGIGALLVDRINAAFEERFHDLLIVEDNGGNPSISEEYRSILHGSWV